MKKWLRNRTVIGILCIVMAFILCFILTPLFNRSVEAKTTVVRFTKAVGKGDLITEGMLEVATVGSYNLPDGLIREKSLVAGQYALTDISKGDYVFPDKLSGQPITGNEYLLNLDGTRQAISISIKSFAAGLSGKLEPGDIVSVIAAGYGEFDETVILPELKYVQVLAATANSGIDTKAAEQSEELPVTVTLLIDEVQGMLLAELENKSTIHIALSYRGDKKTADEFLKEQEDFIIGKYYTIDPDTGIAGEADVPGGESMEKEAGGTAVEETEGVKEGDRIAE